MYRRIALIIPIYNEAVFIDKFLYQLLPVVKKLSEIFTIILINDGSTDKTAEHLAKYTKNELITVLTHSQNQGKGAALRTGFEKAKKLKADGVIAMDSDCQHDPRLLIKFLNDLKKYPVVFGYRDFSREMTLHRRMFNSFIAWVYQSLFFIPRKDPLCGFLGWRKDVFNLMNWRSNDYGVEPEIAAIVSKFSLSYTEVKIPTIYLHKKNGMRFRDAVKMLSKIPYWYWLHNKSTSYPSNRLWAAVASAIIFIWFVCSFKFPFQPTSLIGNLEPFPDTLFYLNPAWSFLKGQGWQLTADLGAYETKSIVPPLYSLVNIPMLWLTNDVRSFYLTNILLGFGSLICWMLITRELLGNRWSTVLSMFLVGILLATHFYLYTLPYLAMAENLTVFLTLLQILFLLRFSKKITLHSAVITGLLPAALFLIKFSNTGLSVIFGLWFIWIILKLKIRKQKKLILLFPLGFGAALCLLYVVRTGVLVGHKNLKADQGFALKYFARNVPFYLRSLAGKQTHLLWFHEKLLTPLFSLLACAGIALALFKKNNRYPWIWLSLLIVMNVGFISFFITPDTRHLMGIIPLLFLAVVHFFTLLFRWIYFKLPVPLNFQLIACICIIVIFSYLFTPGFGYREGEREIITLKKQISLNFRYQETPWHYLAVQEWQQLTSQLPRNENSNIYLATVLPPYYVEMVSESPSSFSILPLTPTQEFFDESSVQKNVLQHKTLRVRYQQLINEGHLILVSPYYVDNLHSWREQYDELLTHFTVKKISTGCADSCSLYQLSTKK